MGTQLARTAALLIVAALALLSLSVPADAGAELKRAADLVKADEAHLRIQGAKRLAKLDAKKATDALMKALKVEMNGDAGRRMGAALSALKGEKAVLAAGKHILGWKKGHAVFSAYWALAGLIQGKTATGDGIVMDALAKSSPKELSLRTAALEAVGESGRSDFDEPILKYLEEYAPEHDKKNIFENMGAVVAAGKLAMLHKKKEPRARWINALIHMLETSKLDRLQYHTARALARISGERAHLDANFWRWWVKHGDDGTAKRPDEGHSTARPTFFNAKAVGKRVVIVVDISGSMEWNANVKSMKNPVTGKARGEGPDYSHVRSKLDLAKVELLWTLHYLPEDFLINIVVYSKEHRLLDPEVTGLVKATEKNKLKLSNAVRALKAKGGTNIHGALTRSFKLTRKGEIEGDPATDRKAMFDGVETIFFLTDGTPSWSDDSTAESHVHPKWGSIGNGKFCKPEEILGDITRINTFRKVVIHTIGIGPDHDKDLMEKLAAQNYGDYIDRS